MEAAEGTGLLVKPGLEVETRETVHLVCLFDTVEQAHALQELVYAHLPSFPRTGGDRGRSARKYWPIAAASCVGL